MAKVTRKGLDGVLDFAESSRAASVLHPEPSPPAESTRGGRGGKRSSDAWVKRGQFVPPELWDEAMYQAKKEKLDMSELVTALLRAYLERRVTVTSGDRPTD
jgi:hypothetical protein